MKTEEEIKLLKAKLAEASSVIIETRRVALISEDMVKTTVSELKKCHEDLLVLARVCQLTLDHPNWSHVSSGLFSEMEKLKARGVVPK